MTQPTSRTISVQGNVCSGFGRLAVKTCFHDLFRALGGEVNITLTSCTCTSLFSFFPPATMSMSKGWCFTLNNWSQDEKNHLSQLAASPDCGYIVFQQEVGEENGTPHLQGYVNFTCRKRLGAVKKLVGNRAALFVAKGTAQQNRAYCSKSSTAVEGSLEEYGEIPEAVAGKRNDLEEFKEAVKAGQVSLKRIREEHSAIYMKYPRFCREYVRDYTPDTVLEDFDLHPWETLLIGILDGPVDPREIIFVVDTKGNMGKTTFSEWYRQKHPEDTIVVSPGQKADMVYSCHSTGIVPRVVILDAPRSKQAKIQFDFLEEMKNGSIDVKKYESFQWRFPRPHVVCMLNRQPKLVDEEGEAILSEDRVHIIDI